MALIYPENLNLKGIHAFFTDRDFPFNSDTLLKRFSFKHIYLPVQKHTDRVRILESYEDLLERSLSDAVVTALEDVLVGVRTADCVPLLLCTKDAKVVGAVHAGWRGTSQGILKKTITVMKNRFSVSPDDILIAIGPSIRGCCYEVGIEVVDALSSESGGSEFIKRRDGRTFVDLAEANRRQAINEGVRPENIWLSGDCTFCLPDRYHSYRKSKTTDRQVAFIGIKPRAEDV